MRSGTWRRKCVAWPWKGPTPLTWKKSCYRVSIRLCGVILGNLSKTNPTEKLIILSGSMRVPELEGRVILLDEIFQDVA
jgi:hypothetical protein